MAKIILALIGAGLLAAVAFAVAYRATMNADRPEARDGPPSAPRARITCFSGGKVILDDFAIGDIEISDSGWYRFRSRTTGRRIRTSADCVAVDGAKPAADFKPLLP